MDLNFWCSREKADLQDKYSNVQIIMWEKIVNWNSNNSLWNCPKTFEMPYRNSFTDRRLYQKRKEDYFFKVLKALDFFAFNLLIYDVFILVIIVCIFNKEWGSALPFTEVNLIWKNCSRSFHHFRDTKVVLLGL